MELDAKIDALSSSPVETAEGAPTHWDAEQVAKALIKAFVTLDRLPRVRGPRQPGGAWPAHTVEWADQLAQAELDAEERRQRAAAMNRVILRPSNADIAQMDIALDWLRELRGVDSGMALVATMWALRAARGRSVKALCREKGWAPHTFYRKRAKALSTLAGWLNERGAPVF